MVSRIYRYLYRLCVVCLSPLLNVRYLYLLFQWDSVLEFVVHIRGVLFRYII